MPNTKSAKKALRSSQKKQEYNTVRKFKIKNSIKELKKALQTDPNSYQATLSKAFSAIDKAVKNDYWHKNKASRKKSRLALMVKKSLSESTTETVA